MCERVLKQTNIFVVNLFFLFALSFPFFHLSLADTGRTRSFHVDQVLHALVDEVSLPTSPT